MSTEIKHSPGPFIASKGSEDEPERWLVLANNGTKPYLIASIENGQPGDTLETEGATARLFAAAPDLPPDDFPDPSDPHEEPCMICGKPVPDHVSQYCCSGHMCGCYGMDTNPCICSKLCWEARMEQDGTLEERRIKAGIAVWKNNETEIKAEARALVEAAAAVQQGKAAYEADLLRQPLYHDGTPRKKWEQLTDFAQDSWAKPAGEVAA